MGMEEARQLKLELMEERAEVEEYVMTSGCEVYKFSDNWG